MVLGKSTGVLLASISLSLVGVLPAYADGLWLKAGPVYRGGMEASVSGSSYTQDEGLHAAGPLQLPSGIGDAGSYADRTYDNGYVRRDPGTGNPASLDPSVTWHWGYDSGGQYDAGASTLEFYKTGNEGYQEVLDVLLSSDTGMSGQGAEIVGGVSLRNGAFSVDLCLGLQGIPGIKATFGGTTYSEDIYRMDVVDTYDVSGIAVPSEPHGGTYDGPFDTPPVIPSPTIPNRPASRSTRMIDMNWHAYSDISIKADTDLYELWCGPRLGFRAGDRLSLHLTPRISATYVDASVERGERFMAKHADGSTSILQSWHDEGSESRFVLGAGMAGGADVEFRNGLFAGVWGGYEWVSEDVDVNVGPNTVSIDASGYAAGAVVGFRFGGVASPAPQAVVPVEVSRRVPESPSVDAQAMALGHALYDQLHQISQSSKGPEAVRCIIQTMKERNEEDYAALVAYVKRCRGNTPETFDSNPAAAPLRVVHVEPGEKAYRELLVIAESSNDKQVVRHAIQTMKKHRQEEFAALVEYVQQRKAERAQLAMR